MSAENCCVFVDLVPEESYAKNTPTWPRKEIGVRETLPHLKNSSRNPTVLIFGNLLFLNAKVSVKFYRSWRENKKYN